MGNVNAWAGEDQPYEIRELDGVGDLNEYVQLSMERFGFTAWEQIPAWMIKTWQWAGGFALGAFRDDSLLGFSISFPGFRDGQTFLWSQGLAVAEGSESHGLGLALKVAQRERALEAGYELARWTTMSVNSRPLYLYLGKLGATLTGLYPNMYTSLLSMPYPDEVELTWDLRRDLPRRDVVVPAPHLVTSTPIGDVRKPSDVLSAVGGDGGAYLVEIPWDHIAVLRQADELGDEWYEVIRRAVGVLLEEGYVGTDLRREVDERRSYILFEHKDALSDE